MFHLKRASFFSFRRVEGSPVSFFSLWGCSVMCNSLQLFAQWRENIQSFHPWLRHHGLDRPHSLCFSPSLSNRKVKWELHLRQPRLSDCERLCINAILTCLHNIFGFLVLAEQHKSFYIMLHRWAGQSSQQEKANLHHHIWRNSMTELFLNLKRS